MSLLAAIYNQTTKILATVLNVNSNTNAIQTDVENGLTTQGYTTGRAPNLDAIPTINTNTQPGAIASDVQTGLNSNGYTPTRAAHLDNLSDLDATVSSRRRPYTTRARFTATASTGTTNILSVSGPGVIHGISFYSSSSGETVNIIIDGTLVASYSTISNGKFITPDGFDQRNISVPGGTYQDNSNADVSMGGTLQWEFTSNFTVQTVVPSGSCTVAVMYAN